MKRIAFLAIVTALSFVSPAWSRTIDLMELIDPKTDAVAGEWRLENNSLISDDTKEARIHIPYEPPEEYDFRISFARKKGGGEVVQFLAKAGRLFYWQIGAWDNTVMGFGEINGAKANSNPTTVLNRECLKNDQRYVSVVSVRRDGVKAYLGSKLISQRKTDYKDLGVGAPWNMRDNRLLGLGSRSSPMIFYRIELVEVAGKGKIVPRSTIPNAPVYKK
ncbi:MAG: hypothetical protein NT105_17870 [Verrucomicrobia bacterium]|nr:hypothetical protein [Verrucomicrobiota bacterium]